MVPSITNSLTVAREEVKLGVHVYYIVSMTTTTNSLRLFSLKFLLHSSNSLKVPRTEMKLGTHAFNIISMTTTLFEQQQIASGNFLQILLLHFSNSLKVALMEMKLGTNAYDIVSMTTTYYLNNYK